jgi:hypothetical protein
LQRNVKTNLGEKKITSLHLEPALQDLQQDLQALPEQTPARKRARLGRCLLGRRRQQRHSLRPPERLALQQHFELLVLLRHLGLLGQGLRLAWHWATKATLHPWLDRAGFGFG